VNYRVVILPSAQKELEGIPNPFPDKLDDQILALAREPRPPGCKKMRDASAATWRVRVGNYRIIYEIDDKAKLVTIQRVAHRREAYR
jgi:mRNA interferase RelE/StbE